MNPRRILLTAVAVATLLTPATFALAETVPAPAPTADAPGFTSAVLDAAAGTPSAGILNAPPAPAAPAAPAAPSAGEPGDAAPVAPTTGAVTPAKAAAPAATVKGCSAS